MQVWEFRGKVSIYKVTICVRINDAQIVKSVCSQVSKTYKFDAKAV